MIAVTGGRVLTCDGRDFAVGTVLVEDGRIKAVYEGNAVPEGAEVIDATGMLVTPGIVDSHTHLGIGEEGIGWEGEDYNEMTDPVTPHLRVIDGFNPEEQGLVDAYTGGVTCICAAPGSANVIGGQMIAVKTHGNVVDRMIVKNPVGMKAAFGENPKRVYSGQKKTPSTRMGTAATLREALVKAKNYKDKLDKGAADPDKAPERDLKMEALVPVITGELPLRAHAHRADDIMTAIRIAEEFNLKLVIEHCTEGHRIAGELAQRGIPAIVGPTLSNRSKIELKDKSWTTPIVLMKAGVKVALMTDHPVIPIEQLRIAAALVAREGLTLDEAFRAITINPAEIAGIADRVGSLTEGKDADVVLWDGHPLEAGSHVRLVMIGGNVVHRA